MQTQQYQEQQATHQHQRAANVQTPPHVIMMRKNLNDLMHANSVEFSTERQNAITNLLNRLDVYEHSKI